MITNISRHKERTKEVYTKEDHLENLRQGARNGPSMLNRYKSLVRRIKTEANRGTDGAEFILALNGSGGLLKQDTNSVETVKHVIELPKQKEDLFRGK
jgi:hypothetical protein